MNRDKMPKLKKTVLERGHLRLLVAIIWIAAFLPAWRRRAWRSAVAIAATAMIGILGIGMCAEKFSTSRLNVLEQLFALAGRLLLVVLGLLTDTIGIVLAGTMSAWQWYKERMAVGKAKGKRDISINKELEG